MTAIKPERLLKTLRSVRLRVRLLLAAEALGRLLGCGIAVAAGLAILDWWVHFPAYVRVSFLLVGLSWAGVWAYRQVWRPMVHPISLDQLALGLRALPAEWRDRLAGAVSYTRDGGEGSRLLWERVIQATETSAEQMPVTRLVSRRRALRWGMASVAVVALLGAFAAVSPQLFSIGLGRFARPLERTPWPKRVEIEPLTRDAIVAFSETFSVEMRLRRGDDPDLRGYVTWQRGLHRSEHELMRRDPDGVYRLTLEDIRGPVTYWFSAGDDDTAEHPFLLTTVRRPTVASARMILTPPPYARREPKVVHFQDERLATALAGSRARLEVSLAEPLRGQPERDSVAEIILADGRRQPLVATSPESNVMAAEFLAQSSTTIDVHLVEGHGLESRGGRPYRLIVHPDEPPTVAIESPGGVIEATARAVLSIEVLAADDVGIEALGLMARKKDSDYSPIADLLHQPDPESVDHPATSLSTSYEWDIGAVHPAVGDVISYVVEARDAYHDPAGEPRSVRSSEMKIHIISTSQFAERMRLRLLAARQRLRELLADLEVVEDRTVQLQAGPAAGTPLDESQRTQAERWVARLDRLAAAGRATAGALEDAAGQADRNGEGALATASQARGLSRRLDRAVRKSMKDAADSLSRAVESVSVSDQHQDLIDSAQAQADLSDSLRAMLRELDRWNDFEDMARRLREMLDRQEALVRDVSALRRVAEGRSTEELDEGERDALMRGSVDQSQLRDDASELLEAMEQWTAKRRTVDPAAAESLDVAGQIARDQALLLRLEEAAESIRANQLVQAGESQRLAAEAIRAMIVTLEQKPDRQLANLSRELHDVITRIKRLIESQRSLIERNQRARGGNAPADELADVADRQFSLESTARSVAKKVGVEEEEGPAAQARVLDAAAEMADAAALLERSDGVAAETPQGNALASLEEALALLEQLETRTQQAIAERSLAAIVAALAEIRREQAALHDETSRIVADAGPSAEPSRAAGLRLSRLSKRQQGLRKPVEAVKEKMNASVVYAYVCDQVVLDMDSAAEALFARDGRSAMESQDRILRLLGELIDAASSKPTQKRMEFVQDGGGGAAQPTPSKPIPTLAELKVLRVLQVAVNEETAKLDSTLPEPLARSEEQLREVGALGSEQRKIRELALEMVRNAAAAGGAQ